MAQNKQDIIVGGMRNIGSVSVDSGTIRGGGDPIRPQLIVPLTIQLKQMQNDDDMLAVCWLGARLSADQNASLNMVICQPISHQLITGFPVHSYKHGSMDSTAELRFFLSPAEVEDIERQRHATKSDNFNLFLGLEVVVAGVKTFNSFEPGRTPEQTPWDTQYGIFSQLLPFWTTQISPVSVKIEQSRWVNHVLPNLGYDRLRLIEIEFPPPLPDRPNASTQFDKAKRALDERRYDDCMKECRGLLKMWEKHYQATTKQIVQKIADDRKWVVDDIRRGLLETLWKEVGDVASALHHPEGEVNPELMDGRDARLMLLLTAALSEYVEQR
jgi:hypothetical protein